MRAAWVIAVKDLRRRLRDRSALVLGVLAPLGVSLIMSFAFAGTDSFHASLVLVDQDRGVLAQALRETLAAPELADLLDVRETRDETVATAAVDDGEVGAAIVVPPGFSAAAATDRPLGLRVLSSPDGTVQAQVASAIVESFVAQLNADRLAVHTALAAGVPATQAARLAADAALLRLPEEARAEAGTGRPLKAISYYAPAMGIFFLFFTIGFTARDYFAEQREGTLERIGAAPVRPVAVLAGKSLAAFSYSAVSLTVLALVTSLALGADWGRPAGAALIIFALSVAMTALTALVVAVCRTERQAEGFASVLTFGLVLLGGNFVLIGQAPEVLRRLALTTPNGWALRGLTDLATGAGAVAAVRPALVVLAMAVAVSAAAGLIFRRKGAHR